MRRSVVALCFIGVIASWAEVPDGYYSQAEGKTGQELRAALHEIIRGHNVIRYTSGATNTRVALEVLDASTTVSNAVVLIYSGSNILANTFPTGWNREHMWPNSYGLNSVEPAYSDLFNLRPCNPAANSSRGNKYFDWSDTNSPNYRLVAHVNAPLCSSDTRSWQPRVEERGDIARAMFYMAVRYEGGIPNEPNLELVEDTTQISSSTNLMGRLSTLLEWHHLDPVDDGERLRNNRVFSLYQGNRNPFVDRPEWAAAVFMPQLSISFTSTGIRLRWPDTGLPVVLQSSGILAGGWTQVDAPVSSDAQGFYMDLPAEQPFQKYRLMLQ